MKNTDEEVREVIENLEPIKDLEVEMKKPKNLEEKHLEYLDDLRESGVTNMFGAGSYLREEYPELSRNEASDILSYWMKTFEERNCT